MYTGTYKKPKKDTTIPTRITGVNKFKNKSTTVYGIKFDSKKEAERFLYLKSEQAAGRIAGLERQKKFELIPAQTENGRVVERAVNYYADFVYTRQGEIIVEDTKGLRTKDYIIKRKLMLYLWGIRIHEV